MIQFPSKSLHVHFIYAVRLCSSKSESFATHFIESKVKGKICLENECKLGFIHSSCYFEKFANPKIKVTVPVLLPGVPNESCNIQCTREKQDFFKEKVKQKVISAVMQGSRLKIREEPKEMSISYLETEEDKICDPGFEMKGSIGKSLCLADPDMLWIVFMIFLIVVSLILLCCCWSIFKCLCNCNFFKRKNEFSSNKKVPKSVSESSGNPKAAHRKPSELKQPLDGTLPKRRLSAPESSFVIPSVRHSAGRDFFYKPLRPVTEAIVPPPPPPPPPPTSASSWKEKTRNMTYHTVGSVDKPETRNAEQVERTAHDRHTTNKIPYTSLNGRNEIMPQYRERIKKSKPMYAAYSKERI